MPKNEIESHRRDHRLYQAIFGLTEQYPVRTEKCPICKGLENPFLDTE